MVLRYTGVGILLGSGSRMRLSQNMCYHQILQTFCFFSMKFLYLLGNSGTSCVIYLNISTIKFCKVILILILTYNLLQVCSVPLSLLTPLEMGLQLECQCFAIGVDVQPSFSPSQVFDLTRYQSQQPRADNICLINSSIRRKEEPLVIFNYLQSLSLSE